MSTPTEPLRSLLELGRQQSDQYHYAKFRMVTTAPAVLASSGRNSDFLLRLSNLPAETVLGMASTFVWLNIHRLFRRIANDDVGPDFLHEVDALLLTAFDCFLPLPETQAVHLVNRTGTSLVLPCAGVSFAVGAGDLVDLQKFESKAPVATDPETGAEFPRAATESVIREGLWGGAYVLHAKNEELFETFYLHEITGAPQKCGGYRERVLGAIDDIRRVDRSLAETIMGDVRWFVPIGTTQDEHYFSFTSAMLKDVLFISLHQSNDDLVEAIIHEYHHGALNYYMDTIRVFDGSDDAIYYSPWKTEPRPMSGLFHGLFVFSACLEYYMRADTTGSTARSRYRRARAEDIYYKLCVASRQIPPQTLTPEGAAIGRACDSVRASALAHWPSLSGPAPLYVSEHALQWQETNPTLALLE